MAQRYLADVTGQLSAAGAGFATSDPMLIWTKAIVTAQASNSPTATWTVGIGTHTGITYHPLAVGMIGSSISCGPYTLAPGEVLVISLIGGGASDTIKAALFGLQDVDPNNVGMDTAVGSATSVQINGGTVTATISGTVPVTITGTPTVNIGNTPAVSISGTPTVSIGGTAAVSITANSVNFPVLNAAGTKITSARPPSLLVNLLSNPNPSTTNVAIPADIQALVVELPNALSKYVHLKISWKLGAAGSVYVPLELYSFQQNVYVIPLLPSNIMLNQGVATTVDILLEATDLLGVVGIYALYESAPLWLQLFPQPQLAPNQLPTFLIVNVTLAQINTWLPVIAAVANVEICLFQILLQALQGIAGGVGTLVDIDFGFGATAITVTEFETLLINDSVGTYGAGPGALTFNGAPLGRGNGLWMRSNNGSGLFTTYGHLVYSLR